MCSASALHDTLRRAKNSCLSRGCPPGSSARDHRPGSSTTQRRCSSIVSDQARAKSGCRGGFGKSEEVEQKQKQKQKHAAFWTTRYRNTGRHTADMVLDLFTIQTLETHTVPYNLSSLMYSTVRLDQCIDLSRTLRQNFLPSRRDRCIVLVAQGLIRCHDRRTLPADYFRNSNNPNNSRVFTSHHEKLYELSEIS